jgi:NitT/TauT family transport system substrate-binding protein
MAIDRRALLRLALASAGAHIATAAGGASAGEVVRISDTLPGNVGALWRPLISSRVAGTLGGLALEWVGANPGQMQVQMVAGVLDVSFSGAVGTVELNTRGADLVLFGPGSNNHLRWLVRGNSGYQKPADLVGKRIATQSETSEQFKQTRIAATSLGLDLKRDFEIIFGPATANYALFQRGDVDAVIIPEPTASRLVAGGAREIAHIGRLLQDALGSNAPTVLVGLAARRPWVESNPETARQIARTFFAANALVHGDPQIIARSHAELGVPASETGTIELLPQRLVDAYSLTWDRSTFDVLDGQIEGAIKAGILAGRPPRPIYVATDLKA